MDKVITYNLNEDFIEKIADYIDENFLKAGLEIGKLAFVFEGKRPALFLRRALARRRNKCFFSPTFFSIDEFVHYTLSKKTSFIKMPSMESWHIIYILAKDIAPEIIRGREKFSDFLPWAKEISNFIDSLDIENVSDEALKDVQASAAIGYDIPESINASLKNIIAIRKTYHQILLEKNSFSRGFIYLSAAQAIKKINFDEFDKIFFSGFFYMEKTERELIKYLYESGKAILFFQGDEDKWPVLKAISQELSFPIKPAKNEKDNYFLNIYAAFDRHSQVGTVREILKRTEKLGSTVIILPEPATLLPLISELGASFGEFNVSLGYPLKRSSLYSLFELIVAAQKTKKKGAYYAKDYIATLSQPLVKNLRILSDYRSTRILVHKIEEALLGMEHTSISGHLFIKLKDVEEDFLLFQITREVLRHMGIEVTFEDLKNILKELHQLLFLFWEGLSNFQEFASSLGKFLDILLRRSFIESYPLNLKIIERLYGLQDELENAPFSKEDFPKEDLFRIFQNMLENEMVPFLGSPLKGMQVLGLLETRTLNFENVIIMDANESKLPRFRLYDPLIPQEIKLSLGLDIVKNEEEIQRYQFKRIISAAKNVFLVYAENPKSERSRFVEELIWQREKEKKSLEIRPVSQVRFSVNVLPARVEIKKNKQVISYLKNFSYSATSVNIYLYCPLQFYYQYVLGLKEKEELIEEPEGREIGTFIHELLETAFIRFINKKPQIDQDFRKDFFNIFEEKFKREFGKSMRSDSFLLENVMRFRLNRFLDAEEINEERKIKEILYLEREFQGKIELSGDIFNFVYVIDRVDRLEDGSILILDYKTGSDIQKPQSINSLEKMEFSRESIRDKIRSFQLPLYYYFEKKKYNKESLKTALYSLRNLKLTYFLKDKAEPENIMDICIKALDFILHEILDSEKAFIADREEEKRCKYCPFFYMCG